MDVQFSASERCGSPTQAMSAPYWRGRAVLLAICGRRRAVWPAEWAWPHSDSNVYKHKSRYGEESLVRS